MNATRDERPSAAKRRATRLEELRETLDIDVDSDMLNLALTHRSYAYEHGGLPHNERLEFLGDAVLGIVVTDTVYRAYPDVAEGQLAKLRAAVVNARPRLSKMGISMYPAASRAPALFAPSATVHRISFEA